MGRPTVKLDLASDHRLARDLVAGGVFVPDCTVQINQDCDLVIRAGVHELTVPARVVWIDGVRGAGLQLECNAEMKLQIAALAKSSTTDETGHTATATATAGPGPAAEPGSGGIADVESAADLVSGSDATDAPEQVDGAAGDGSKAPGMHERLRHLTLAQQIKLAHKGEVAERILLERMYGKTVWEALLRNPRVTGPEVARIARMGALPRPLIEIIVGNGGWLQIPEVRRALLSNPRLGTDQIIRVLRLLPKHELKIAATQTVYPAAVRDVARKLIRDNA